MRERGMAMVPTLQLFSVNPEPMLDAILREVGDYQRLGGEIWFGTDVGYIDDYDPALEFALLRRAGLSFDQILAALSSEEHTSELKSLMRSSYAVFCLKKKTKSASLD